MPLRVSHAQQAWVKVPPKKKQPKQKPIVSPGEAREALCAPLRYFACRPLDGRDRVRMLDRPYSGMDGMVDVDRAPSPVADQWQGAGLMFQNGSRSGQRQPRKVTQRDRDRGFDEEFFSDEPIPRAMSRIVSEPAMGMRGGPRPSSVYSEEDLVQVIEIEDRAPVEDDQMSRRSLRSHRSNRSHRSTQPKSEPIPEKVTEAKVEPTPIPEPVQEPKLDPAPVPAPASTLVTTEKSRSVRSASPPPPSIARFRQRSPARSEISVATTHRLCRDCEPPPSPRARSHRKVCHGCRSPVPPSTVGYDDTMSYRSASPLRTVPYKVRQRSPPPQMRREYQQRTFTAPAITRTSRPIERPSSSAPLSSNGYKFQSAIFQSRSSGNNYRDVYSRRGRDGSVGPASWASATSALSFE